MSLAEIEEKVIRPLTREEKWQLIEDVQKMLREEENDPLKKLIPGDTYPLYTPVGLEAAADQLQRYIDEGKL